MVLSPALGRTAEYSKGMLFRSLEFFLRVALFSVFCAANSSSFCFPWSHSFVSSTWRRYFLGFSRHFLGFSSPHHNLGTHKAASWDNHKSHLNYFPCLGNHCFTLSRDHCFLYFVQFCELFHIRELSPVPISSSWPEIEECCAFWICDFIIFFPQELT